MLSEWDISQLELRRGRCTGTIDLLLCNTKIEDSLIIQNESDIATCNCRLLKLSNVQFCSKIEAIHKV